MITSIQKWGNSQGIRIPKFLLEAVQWSESEKLSLNVDEDRIVITKAERRKNIKELFADYDGEYEAVEINWGEPVGEEVW